MTIETVALEATQSAVLNKAAMYGTVAIGTVAAAAGIYALWHHFSQPQDVEQAEEAVAAAEERLCIAQARVASAPDAATQ